MYTNTTGGIANTALGYQSLRLNVSGGSNTAVGYCSLRANTASNNTAVGFESL
jgi:trimeric autotransporter adhesin